MSIAGLTNAGAAPALEAVIRFSTQRQRVLAHNIANISTPDFRPTDLSVADFQTELAAAIDRRRQANAPDGPLKIRDTRELVWEPDGSLTATPRQPSDGVLWHDRNNRDLERLMQAQTENMAVFRTAADLLRGRTEAMRSALAQRV